MFSAGDVALGLTVVASAVPLVGGILKSYVSRKAAAVVNKDRNSDRIVVITDVPGVRQPAGGEAEPASSLEDTREIQIQVKPAAPAAPPALAADLEDTREFRISHAGQASPRKSYIARRVAVLVAFALFSVGLVWFISRPGGLLQSSPPSISSDTLGTPTHSRVIATLVWLFVHESFYQLLLLFAVLFAVLFNKRRLAALAGRLDASGQVLMVFAGIVLYFGCSAIIHYWHQISLTVDKFYLALGLFFTMIGGMFVQVITGNYKAGAASLFGVTTTQLIYPVLFSPIVYYAIWAVASSSSAGIFSFYAAFLNGYFWRSVVNSAQSVGKQIPA